MDKWCLKRDSFLLDLMCTSGFMDGGNNIGFKRMHDQPIKS